jgi:hypothetical protein
MIKYLFHKSPNMPLDCTSHCVSLRVLSTMIRRSRSYTSSSHGSAMSWSLEYTLSATCTGGSAPTTLASATRPYVPDAIRPSTRNWNRPSLMTGPCGPTSAPSSGDRGGEPPGMPLHPSGIVGTYVHELVVARVNACSGSELARSLSGTRDGGFVKTRGGMGSGAGADVGMVLLPTAVALRFFCMCIWLRYARTQRGTMSSTIVLNVRRTMRSTRWGQQIKRAKPMR